jgi:hypothetical protein
MTEPSASDPNDDANDDQAIPEPHEITYDEQFYPARPRRLRPSVRRTNVPGRPVADGLPRADNPAYVNWLREKSMLRDANLLAVQLSGQGSMWQNPFAHPDPRAAVKQAQVWFTAYPLSFITRPGASYLATLGDPDLWDAFRQIGIDAVHTGPVKVAGGVNGWSATPVGRRPLRPGRHADRPSLRY